MLFAVSGGPIRMLTTPDYVDGASYLAEAAGFWFLAAGQFWPFVAAVTVGVLNRETALLLVVLYLVATPPGRSTWKRAALVVLLPCAVFALVVVAKLAAGGVLSGATPLATLAPFARTFRQDLPSVTELFDLYSTFGVLWLLALRHLPGPTSFQRRSLVFAALIVLQLVVSRGDEGRNLSHLFPVLVPLAMLDVERLWTAGGRSGRLLAVGLVLACAASLVHARWTFLEPTALRYGLVAGGTSLALLLAWITPMLARSEDGDEERRGKPRPYAIRRGGACGALACPTLARTSWLCPRHLHQRLVSREPLGVLDDDVAAAVVEVRAEARECGVISRLGAVQSG